MRAVQYTQFGSADVLHIAELARPQPKDDEVIIEVTAAGVNYVDIRQRQGAYNRAETRVGGIDLPSIPGMQVVGIVVEAGPLADASLLGKNVVALVSKGAYAEYVAAPASMCVPVPDGVDDTQLAALPTQGLTAYFVLTASTLLQRGETVLVHAAAGGVGSLAVQIAKILGAGTVIATAATAAKRNFALSIGADIAVDYTQTAWTSAVIDATNGRGVDILLESIGGKVFEENFSCLAAFGRYVLFGSTQGVGDPFEARRLMTKAQSMTGFYLPVFFGRPDLIQQGLRFLIDQVAQGTLHAHVAAQFSLTEAAAAQQSLEDRNVIGAVVLRPKLR
jgi:NADPH2:quinone reductase